MKTIGVWRITAAVPHVRAETERWLETVPGRVDPRDCRLQKALAYCEKRAKPEEELFMTFTAAPLDDLFSVFHGDGCHWGPSELYPTHEQLLKLALEDDIKQFDTGWFSSKKEIASFRVRRDNDEVICQASCSDDFDTEGRGETVIHLLDRGGEGLGFNWVEHSYDCIIEALGEAWDQAEGDRKENEVYEGYSIHFLLTPEGTSGPWMETLILPRDPDYDEPPGDNYESWGFQGNTELPHYLKDWIERWAWDRLNGWADGESKVFELREPVIYVDPLAGLDNVFPYREQVEVPVTRVMVKRWEED